MLTELGDVLVRPAFATRLALLGRTAHEVLADYIDVVELVTPLSVPRVVRDDPDDDQVLAAAAAAEADLIVSGDRQLLALGSYNLIRIVPPSEAVRLIVSSRS